MRLLEIRQDGTLSLTRDLMKDEEVPAYAILSHTWLPGEEVTFDEFTTGVGHGKSGYSKIRFCAQQADRDGLRYFWVDTCCINKGDTVELQHAINSMFRWYQKAARCYVFLSDVSTAELEMSSTTCAPWKQALRGSRWFTRGWTLQELLAPRFVNFFSQDGKFLGNRHELKQEIHDITSIPVSALTGASLDCFSINERMSWSERRCTTREEDKAYSLLGIFGVFMFLNYGEGQNNAFKRLQKAIEEDPKKSPQPLGLLTLQGGHSTFHMLGTHEANYHIPFPKNRYFVGRKEELDILNQKLLVDRDCQKMSIVGLGGTGKTQIALQFAYMVKETMSAVSIFWMPALSMESFEQACASIVVALHIGHTGAGEDDAKELLRDHLSLDRAARWLLVLDNADDPDLLFGTAQSRGILDFLPESEKGITLFTTRTQEIAVSLTRGDVLELGSMGRQDAINFLEKSVIKKSLVQDGEATGELLDELACLPLAIAQAASYLNMNRTNITKYLQLIRNTEQDMAGLMSKEFRDHTRYKGSTNAIASTWVVSFTQLREHDAVAADLLNFMSCVEWKAIPRSLLPKVQPEERMEQAIGTLCGYSFISRRNNDNFEKVEGKEEWYDLHRLVHLATRIWVSKYGDATDVTNEAMKHVAKVFPSDDFANQAVWRAYMPHTLRLLKTKQSCNVEDQAHLSLRVGRCLHADGRVSEAVTWLEECCQLRGVLAETHPDQLTSQHQLGVSYWADGRIKESVALLEHVVKTQNTTLAETHPDRLASQHQLGVSYRADGRIKKAVALLEHVVKVRNTTLAETRPSRLASQHQLGVSYQADGRITEAVTLLEHVVKVHNITLAETHPDRLASQHQLGVSYRADGRIKEAVALLEHVVKVRNTTLAETHPDQLASQHELGVSYWVDGRIKEAVALLEHVVKVRNTTLAETHPGRLASQHQLGVSYKADGQIKEAVALLEHVVKVQDTTLSETHPDRLASQHQLGVSYQADGRIKEAAALLEHVVKVRNTTLAETHPDRLASQHQLGVSYKADGRIKEAVALIEHVVKMRNTTLAEAHPDRLVSQHQLGVSYWVDGRIKEAVALLEHVVKVRDTMLAESHPDRLASQHELAVSYWEDGRMEEAVSLLEHVVKVRNTTLAETHPSRLASQHELGVSYWADGRIKEAVALLEHVVKVRNTTLAEAHPDQLASQHMLGVSYQADGRIKEGVTLLEHVVKVHNATLADTHPDRLASQHQLGVSYQADGRIKEAVILLEHVVRVHNATLAETHPSRLASQHALGVSYCEDGRTQEGVTLLEHVVKVRNTTLAEAHPDRLVSQHALGVSYKADGRIKEGVALLEHVVQMRNTTLVETHPDRLESQHQLGLSYWADGRIKEAVALLEHVVKVRNATLAETHPDRLASAGWLSHVTSQRR